MKAQFCIIGATSGTGLLIARQLLQRGLPVRIVARDPDKARRVLDNQPEVIHGDVTDAPTIPEAIAGDCTAIFFTVAAGGGFDGRGMFASGSMIREVTYQGLLNVVDAARSIGFSGRMILPSLVGVDRPSVLIRILNKIKPGLHRNLIERELYLRASGLDYSVVRAPILTNAPAGEVNLQITRPINKLTARSKIPRGDLARVMILVAQQPVGSRKTFELLAFNGAAPSDDQLVAQLKRIPAGS
jgi:nucleoside-diphosphate-sugar epimerase